MTCVNVPAFLSPPSCALIKSYKYSICRFTRLSSLDICSIRSKYKLLAVEHTLYTFVQKKWVEIKRAPKNSFRLFFFFQNKRNISEKLVMIRRDHGVKWIMNNWRLQLMKLMCKINLFTYAAIKWCEEPISIKFKNWSQISAPFNPDCVGGDASDRTNCTICVIWNCTFCSKNLLHSGGMKANRWMSYEWSDDTTVEQF